MQKHKVEDMLRQSIKAEGSYNFDFSAKYGNLMHYFRERFKLANIYVGDEQINEFLRQNEQQLVNLIKETK